MYAALAFARKRSDLQRCRGNWSRVRLNKPVIGRANGRGDARAVLGSTLRPFRLPGDFPFAPFAARPSAADAGPANTVFRARPREARAAGEHHRRRVPKSPRAGRQCAHGRPARTTSLPPPSSIPRAPPVSFVIFDSEIRCRLATCPAGKTRLLRQVYTRRTLNCFTRNFFSSPRFFSHRSNTRVK